MNGGVLRKLRRERNITQEKMAEDLGISRQTYIAIENGSKDPSVSTLEKIASILGVSSAELLSDWRDNRKFLQMYFYVLRKFPNGIPKTKFAKLLYLADFTNFYETLEPISGVSYVRRSYGPVADIFFETTENLYDIGKIDITPLDGGAMMIKSTTQDIKDDMLSDDEKHLIDKICNYWHDQKTQTIVNFTHEQKPWKSCRDGETIPYSLIVQEEPDHVYAPLASQR